MMEYEKEDPKDYLLSVERQRRDAIARIDELTAEVARYKAALGEIVDPYSYGWSRRVYLDGIDYQDIARNALKDGDS